MYEKKFTLRHVIRNFPKMLEEYSQEEEHFGVPWQLCVKHIDHDLSVYLHCNKEKDERRPWTVCVDYRMRLVSVFPVPVDVRSSQKFDKKEGRGRKRFHSWSDVVMHYMVDNTVVVECEVTITNMVGFGEKRKLNFDDSKENLTDVVLKIGDRKFNVLKGLLATHSPYFNALFFGKFSEADKSEIELYDVNADDFQCVLEVIYGEQSVDEDNVEGLLSIADKYDVNLVRRRCEEFLLQSRGIFEKSKLDNRMRLRLADTYNLENLKKSCLDSIFSVEDIRRFVPNNIADLSYPTVCALLQKALEQEY